MIKTQITLVLEKMAFIYYFSIKAPILRDH